MADLKRTGRGGRATIRTVAAEAGVSVAAVSKVLRNAYGVSDGLREKVLESIGRLDYRPSVAARGMRGKTYRVGVLLVEIANPFLPEIIAGVNCVLAQSSYKSLIGIGQSAQAIETSLIESMIDSHMDGLILVAPRIASATISAYARELPIVVIGHHCPTATTYDTVNADDARGAALATEALIAAGHRAIAMASLGDDIDAAVSMVRQRETGYRRAMQQAGLADQIRVIYLPDSQPELTEAATAMLLDADRPTALFCWSDLHGICILDQAKMLGLRLPEDLALVAYDNSSVAALPLIGLASIDQVGRAQGHAAAELLLSRVEGRATAEHLVMEPTLVRRSSLGSAGPAVAAVPQIARSAPAEPGAA